MTFARISSFCQRYACRTATSGIAIAAIISVFSAIADIPAAVAQSNSAVLTFQMVRSAAAGGPDAWPAFRLGFRSSPWGQLNG
jgi:hypothetical protein